MLERKNHSSIAAAKNALKTALTFAFEKTHFVNNRKAFVTGVVISALAVASCFSLSLRSGRGGVPGGLAQHLEHRGGLSGHHGRQALGGRCFPAARSLGTKVGSIGAAHFHDRSSPCPSSGRRSSPFTPSPRAPRRWRVFPIIVAVVNILFYHLLKAPTLLGRRILDKIEGFKMFLAATETDRLQRIYPAGRTPELYEKFLPYALALGVEQQWTEQFTDVLAAAARPDGSRGYHPRLVLGLKLGQLAHGQLRRIHGKLAERRHLLVIHLSGVKLRRWRRRLLGRRRRRGRRGRLVAIKYANSCAGEGGAFS